MSRQNALLFSDPTLQSKQRSDITSKCLVYYQKTSHCAWTLITQLSYEAVHLEAAQNLIGRCFISNTDPIDSKSMEYTELASWLYTEIPLTPLFFLKLMCLSIKQNSGKNISWFIINEISKDTVMEKHRTRH